MTAEATKQHDDVSTSVAANLRRSKDDYDTMTIEAIM